MRKLRKKSYTKIYKNMTLKFSFILMICVFAITIGYSALSSTLSINGSAKFIPVGLIRVMSIERNALVNTTEVDVGHTNDTINVLIDLNDTTATATYDVNITNLGQIDKQLTHILEDVYSNSDVEYVLNGLDIDDVIVAGESRDFTITFKYKNGVTPQTSRLNAQLQFVFDDYEDTSTFPVVFRQDGACTFNGSNATITGVECSRYLNKYYIDTGVELYSTSNWQKDYEIGFTIESYVPSQQEKQAVFVNAKYEKTSLKWPGIVFRRTDQTDNLELTQSINNGNKALATFSNNSFPMSVKIYRINKAIYYSINGGELVLLQNMSNFNQQFDVTTWFGAAPDENGVPMRHLKATLSNMYVKLGTYIPETYTIRFHANGGTVSETERTVAQFSTLGALPTPTYNEDWSFAGWYTDLTFQTRADPNSIVMGDADYYAKWTLTKNIEMNGQYYNTIAEALTVAGSTPSTIILHDDVDEIVSIPSTANITINLQNHNMTNPTTNAVITNEGILKVMNGTLRNTSNFAVIDNLSTGTLEVVNATIIGAGTKQAIYNNGGYLTISGDSHLSAVSSIRATLQNLNSGTAIVKSGTILASNYSAVKNENGCTLIIGDDDGSVDTTEPLIQGKPYGITSSVNYSMYDGIIKGTTKAVNDDTKITAIDSNSQKVTGTESIDGTTYKTLYLNQTVNNNNNSNGLLFSTRRQTNTLNTVFEINGTCNFDGLGGNITGEGCEEYSDKGYIDTGISLFSNENWQKDFEIYFELSNYNPEQPDTSTIQNTIMNSLTENTLTNNPGIVFRKTGDDLTLKVNGASQSVVSINTPYAEVNKVKIVRKDKKLYYSVNDSELQQVYDFTDFSKQFDLPVWFGASANSAGSPYRYTKCTLSNIYIKMGN